MIARTDIAGAAATALGESHDPVVRMPRTIAPAAEGHGGVGVRFVLVVAGVGALVGGALGAVGLGIVRATQSMPARTEDATATLREAPVAALPEAFALVAAADVAVAPVRAEGDPDNAEQVLGAGRTLA